MLIWCLLFPSPILPPTPAAAAVSNFLATLQLALRCRCCALSPFLYLVPVLRFEKEEGDRYWPLPIILPPVGNLTTGDGSCIDPTF